MGSPQPIPEAAPSEACTGDRGTPLGRRPAMHSPHTRPAARREQKRNLSPAAPRGRLQNANPDHPWEVATQPLSSVEAPPVAPQRETLEKGCTDLRVG